MTYNCRLSALDRTGERRGPTWQDEYARSVFGRTLQYVKIRPDDLAQWIENINSHGKGGNTAINEAILNRPEKLLRP